MLLNWQQKEVLYATQCVNIQFILKINFFLSAVHIGFIL